MKLKWLKKQSGVTLLETILVLTLASFVIMMGIRQYELMKRENDLDRIRFNVDQLFQAASYWYQANCKRQPVVTNPGTFIADTGALDPANNPASPFRVEFSDLVTDGFLDNNVVTINPLVNDAGTQAGLNNAYIVQFNLAPLTQKTVNINPTTTVNLGTIYVWKIQVAVQLRPTRNATTYGNILSVNCLSGTTTNTAGQTVVTPCDSVTGTPTGTPYLVWEKLPGFLSSETSSPYWSTMPVIKQFANSFEQYPMGYLAQQPQPYPQQNYLCGS